MKIENFDDFKQLNNKELKGICEFIGMKYEYLKGDTLDMKKIILHNIIKDQYRQEAISFLNKTITVGISYSTANNNIMNIIMDCLKQENYNICIDLTNIQETNYIIDAFERKLAKQDIFLILMSEDYLESEHCMYELYYSFIYNRQNVEDIVFRTIPLWIDGTDLGDENVLTLQKLWMEKKNNLSKKFNKLKGVNRKTFVERISIVDNICYNFSEILNTLKNINMIKVDPNNPEDCIQNLIQRIEKMACKWE